MGKKALGILFVLGLIGLFGSAAEGGNSNTQSTDKSSVSKQISHKVKSSSEKQSSSSSTSSSASSSSAVEAAPTVDMSNGLVGTDQQPLPFSSTKQLVLADRDNLGRARDAHIQLANYEEPTSKRAARLTTNPAGWHNYKMWYQTDGGTKQAWLMARGHLVGYQFSGLNDEPRNLVTETAWMNSGNYAGMDQGNQESMLYYENQLDNWLALHPNWRLDYQVTPLYEGNELVPRQVRLAYVGYDDKGALVSISVNSAKEQSGNGQATVVYLDNVSPNASIDYATGMATNTVQEATTAPAAPEQTAPAAPTQPTDSNSNRTVYVASHGRSDAYWYDTSNMPPSTNMANVIQMTEADALAAGKHHSLKE